MKRIPQAIKEADTDDLLKGICTFHTWFHAVNSNMGMKMVAGMHGINSDFWNKYQMMVNLATEEINRRRNEKEADSK